MFVPIKDSLTVVLGGKHSYTIMPVIVNILELYFL